MCLGKRLRIMIIESRMQESSFDAIRCCYFRETDLFYRDGTNPF